MGQEMFFTDLAAIKAEATLVEPKVDWGIGVNLSVRLVRLPRQRCSACQLRRVCFSLSVENAAAGSELKGPPVCAQHAGIR